jgi:salicylate hydroxylase
LYKASVEELLSPYPDLDPELRRHLEVSEDISPWRLWVHQPYPYWVKGRVALMGDAAHPMLPHQSQGACQALEDAAALGIVLSKKYFSGSVENALMFYENIRRERVAKVQEASMRENLNDRVGFSEITNNKTDEAERENNLTSEELFGYDMWADVESKPKIV